MLGLSVFVFVAFVMLFLGGVVYVNDPKRRTNRLFLFWVAFCVIWMVSNYLETVSSLTIEARELFLRMDFATGILASGFLLLFTLAFINPKISLRRLAPWFLPAVVLACLSFTRWHLPRVFLAETGEIRFDEGEIVFPLYAVFLIAYFVISCFLFWRHRSHSTGAVRAQTTNIAIGLSLTTIGTLGINLFLQNVLPAELFRFGIYSMLFFEIAVAYSIARHEFLRIRVVAIEILLMGILATLLTRTILATSLTDAAVTLVSFIAMLILGFAMVRSFLTQAKQKEELAKLSEQLSRANEHLKLANKKLKELDSLKTEFLSIASHQLRTPLAVAKGYLSMLSEGMVGSVSKRQEKTISLLESNNEGLIALVNQLLNLSRIESNRLKINLSRVDLGKAASETSAFFAPRAKEKGTALRLEAPKAPIFVTADPEKLREILTNLLDNAIKYTEKGSITMRLSHNGHAFVDVIDTGYGLTEKDKRHLFEKFASGSASAHANVTSGFGLFVVRKLAEAMGGSVSADSPGPGKGSTFRVALPLAKGGLTRPGPHGTIGKT
jgi:signal transduction histidine kinase